MNIFKTVFALIISSMLVNANEVDDLIKDLESGDKAKRREAARSLSLLGDKAKAAVPALPVVALPGLPAVFWVTFFLIDFLNRT